MIEQRLIAELRCRANWDGLVMVREEVLLEKLQSTQAELVATLGKLENAGLIEVLTPGKHLVIKARTWPGRETIPAGNAPRVGAAVARGYSYSKLSSNRLNKSYGPDADAALMKEILETLGETDPKSFEGAIKNYSRDVIRKALDRVRRTRSLRKKPTALFRYLLTKLS